MTAEPQNPTQYSVIGFLCDTVRRELEGKVSLIGIMDGRLTAPAFPMALVCGIFIRMTPPPPEGTDLQIQVLLDETILFEMATVAPPDTTDTGDAARQVMMALDRLILTIDHPGKISARLRIGAADPATFFAMTMTHTA